MTEETGLVPRSLSSSELRKLIELGKKGNFGFEGANPAVLNAIYLLCLDLQLRPGDEVIAYQGKPYVNERGTLTLVRRHPEYRGFSPRPLTAEEKEAWGYEATDRVIETTIRTARWGDIVGHGKVTQKEVESARARANQPNARGRGEPLGTAPVEMAMKRSLMRAAQAAFGWDALPPELDDSRMVVTEIEDRQAKAQRYEEIFGTDDNDFIHPHVEVSQQEQAETTAV